MSVSGLRKYDKVDWPSLVGDQHPLDWTLARGLSVYCQVDRNLHFAVISQWRDTGNVRVVESQYVASPPRDLLFQVPDESIAFLRLDDELIDVLRVGGDVRVREFRSGGLEVSRSETGSEGGGVARVAEIHFKAGILVDRKMWDVVRRTKTHDALRTKYADIAVTLCVKLEDLYFEAEDVASTEPWEDYPFEHPRRPLAGDLLWLYRAAYAYRLAPNTSRDEFKLWLEKYAPLKVLVGTRRWRTARILLQRRYRNEKSLNKALLAQLPHAEELLSDGMDFLPTALKCALAVHHWWIEQSAPRAQQAESLARKLFDMGFSDTAVQDLLFMIGGLDLEDAEWDVIRRQIATSAQFDAAKRNARLDFAGVRYGAAHGIDRENDD